MYRAYSECALQLFAQCSLHTSLSFFCGALCPQKPYGLLGMGKGGGVGWGIGYLWVARPSTLTCKGWRDCHPPPEQHCHTVPTSITPSLPQPVKFLGWMVHRRACKQYIFRSYNICFKCYAFWWKSFCMPVWKRRQKDWRVSNFALLWVVFKWHHGSEGVNSVVLAVADGLFGLYESECGDIFC